MSLHDISAYTILENRELRRKLLTGNYPDVLKRKVAALYIEEWLIRNALARYTQAKFEYTKEERSKFHGFVFHPHYLKSIAFYWFGKQHGYVQEDNELDSDAYVWYYLDKRNGPCLVQTSRNGEQTHNFYDMGEPVEEETYILQWGDDYDKLVQDIRDYETDSELCNRAADICVRLADEKLNNY
jgi:hypothetical protein